MSNKIYVYYVERHHDSRIGDAVLFIDTHKERVSHRLDDTLRRHTIVECSIENIFNIEIEDFLFDKTTEKLLLKRVLVHHKQDKLMDNTTYSLYRHILWKKLNA